MHAQIVRNRETQSHEPDCTAYDRVYRCPRARFIDQLSKVAQNERIC